jgi:predicted DCC family thiol-disulfide oxidoreductase YuxK
MEISDLPINKNIILFDGDCNLCSRSVQYIIQYDKNDKFRFASLQSNIGKKIINHLGIDNKKVDSIILYQPNKAYYIKAEAIKLIIKNFSSWHSILYLFIPSGIFGSTIYNYIAKYRYKWFGKNDVCLLPAKQLKCKFLE